MTLEYIYYLIGRGIVIISSLIGTVYFIGWLLKILLDYLGEKFKSLWVIVEFAYYRRDFLEWVKDKKRIKK